MRLLDAAFLEVPFLGSGDLGGALLDGETVMTLASQFTIYVGTDEFVTGPDDDPPNTPFHGSLTQALTFRRSILGGARIGDFSAGYGETIISNAEGEFDFLIQRFAIDGRPVLIKAGFPDQSYAEFVTAFDGVASDWEVNSQELRVKLRDPSFKQDVPAQSAIYAGTGGAEGGADLQGKRKALTFGRVTNMQPALLVPASLIYELNDGQIESVDAVYDAGVPLTFSADYADFSSLAAASISAGFYATSLAAGKMRLGGSPAGQVTVDLHGDKTGGVYVETTADIIARLVTLSTELTAADLDQASFDDVNDVQPAAVGTYLGPNAAPTVSQVIAVLMAGIGGWGGFRRTGMLEIGVFTAPEAPAADRIVESDVEDIDRVPLPSGLSPPPWRFRVAYQRNWTIQTSGLAGAVTDARRAQVAQPYRLAEASDVAILQDHPFAQDPAPIESFFASESDAQAEADRQLALYRNVNSLYRIVLKNRPLLYELGSVVHVTYPRFDLTVGRFLRICEIEENATANTVTIIGFG